MPDARQGQQPSITSVSVYCSHLSVSDKGQDKATNMPLNDTVRPKNYAISTHKPCSRPCWQEALNMNAFWPIVLSVAPLAHCVVCMSVC